MPVRIRAKTKIQTTITPSTLNTETDLINLTDQTDDYIVEGQISLQNMASADAVVIRTYIAVDGTNRVKVDEATLAGTQPIPVVRIPAVTVPANGKFRATITQTTGTVKSYPICFIIQIMETI
ncbi:MAG: hypothetical protein QXH20_00340 [Candidatus Bathyarchaeia archaeon]